MRITNKHIKKMFNIIKKMQIKTVMIFHYI